MVSQMIRNSRGEEVVFTAVLHNLSALLILLFSQFIMLQPFHFYLMPYTASSLSLSVLLLRVCDVMTTVSKDEEMMQNITSDDSGGLIDMVTSVVSHEAK